MRKKDFIKNQLAERGIYDYTEEDLNIIKKEMIEALLTGKDKYEAFEDALYVWRRRKKQ